MPCTSQSSWLLVLKTFIIYREEKEHFLHVQCIIYREEEKLHGASLRQRWDDDDGLPTQTATASHHTTQSSNAAAALPHERTLRRQLLLQGMWFQPPRREADVSATAWAQTLIRAFTSLGSSPVSQHKTSSELQEGSWNAKSSNRRGEHYHSASLWAS